VRRSLVALKKPATLPILPSSKEAMMPEPQPQSPRSILKRLLDDEEAHAKSLQEVLILCTLAIIDGLRAR
jgi:hypothetical protein